VGPDEIYDAQADVFSPNALGAVVNPQTLPRLMVKVVAGGANNQLATPAMGEALAARGILYAPDYVINGGGIINVAAEIRARQAGLPHDGGWVEAKLSALTRTLEQVLDEALREGLPTHVVADRLARLRIAAARP
jgi:leucine dehydrogenase